MMATLGILVTNLSQEHEYFTDIASVGLQKNVQVYIFYLLISILEAE
ncbi:hypothetical protein KHA80_05000 [Anaerobacillus sp. HL2]|nr:hypothetical protein KHA80_05000 [Anaerobacillus sp. HL2]